MAGIVEQLKAWAEKERKRRKPKVSGAEWTATRNKAAPKEREAPPPDSFRAALEGIRDVPFLGSEKYREQQRRADWVGAPDELECFAAKLVKRMAKHGVPMFVAEAARSVERQKQLQAEGVSKCGSDNCPHVRAMAFDMVHSVRGWDIPPRAWALVGHVGKELAASMGIKVVWGGDWSLFYDPAHWELHDWRERSVHPFDWNDVN